MKIGQSDDSTRLIDSHQQKNACKNQRGTQRMIVQLEHGDKALTTRSSNCLVIKKYVNADECDSLQK